MGWWTNFKEKLNPSQPEIAAQDPGGYRTTRQPYTLSQAYKEVEIVNRVVNMFVDACSEVNYDVKNQYPNAITYGTVRGKQLDKLLNVAPNPFMNVNLFRRLLWMDLIMEGQFFIYWDGAGLYHMPAAHMTVVLDKKKYINSFVYDGKDTYTPDQIIHVKDNAYWGNSMEATGFSRLNSSLHSIQRLRNLADFKENFYKNGAVLGLVIENRYYAF